MGEINTVLYYRCSSKHGECYTKLLAAGSQEDMKTLQRHHQRLGNETQLTPLKKIELLKHATKQTLTEENLKGILNGTIPF